MNYIVILIIRGSPSGLDIKTELSKNDYPNFEYVECTIDNKVGVGRVVIVKSRSRRVITYPYCLIDYIDFFCAFMIGDNSGEYNLHEVANLLVSLSQYFEGDNELPGFHSMCRYREIVLAKIESKINPLIEDSKKVAISNMIRGYQHQPTPHRGYIDHYLIIADRIKLLNKSKMLRDEMNGLLC